jgi:hypothetical protein
MDAKYTRQAPIFRAASKLVTSPREGEDGVSQHAGAAAVAVQSQPWAAQRTGGGVVHAGFACVHQEQPPPQLPQPLGGRGRGAAATENELEFAGLDFGEVERGVFEQGQAARRDQHRDAAAVDHQVVFALVVEAHAVDQFAVLSSCLAATRSMGWDGRLFGGGAAICSAALGVRVNMAGFLQVGILAARTYCTNFAGQSQPAVARRWV